MKLIENFNEFEDAYVRLNEGEVPELNEGLLSGIMNFFSKVFGGRVSDLDRILSKYKRNEGEYWKKWAEANHDYNRAVALRDSTEDGVDKRKHTEMMERASKLVRQTTRTRREVNDALDRQARIIVRDNKRLREYWNMKKAKVDERVAKNSYDSLKKQVDEETLDDLYDNVRDTAEKAKEAVKKMPKGSFTVDFGDYRDLSDRQQKAPFSKFGIHDVEDFLYATDELWDERTALMPERNRAELAAAIKKEIAKLEKELADKKRAVRDAKSDDDGKPDLEMLQKELEDAKDLIGGDIDRLRSRLETLTGEKVERSAEEPDQPTDQPDEGTEDDTFDGGIDAKLVRMLGDDVDLATVKADMKALYDRMPDEERSDQKKSDMRKGQLLDYATDIYSYRIANSIDGPLSPEQADELYAEFKKEFA